MKSLLAVASVLIKSIMVLLAVAVINFMLVRILSPQLSSGELFERAIRRNMMIRDCSTFPFLDQHYIRFCIMDPEMNTKLLACLLE